MANWASLVEYMNRNHQVADQNDSMVKLIVNTGDLRTQLIVMWRAALLDGTEDWVIFESPFAELSRVDLDSVLKETSGLVCGALGLVGDMLTLRHSVPLENVDPNEIERPLGLISGTADRLERQFVGTDQF